MAPLRCEIDCGVEIFTVGAEETRILDTIPPITLTNSDSAGVVILSDPEELEQTIELKNPGDTVSLPLKYADNTEINDIFDPIVPWLTRQEHLFSFTRTEN